MRWTIDPARRLIDIVLEGETTPDDATRFFDDIEANNAVPFSKLIDATSAVPRIDEKVLKIVTARIAGYVDLKPGPVAVVVPPSTIDGLAKLFVIAVEAERRTRLFRSVAEGRAWLDEIANEEKSP